MDVERQSLPNEQGTPADLGSLEATRADLEDVSSARSDSWRDRRSWLRQRIVFFRNYYGLNDAAPAQGPLPDRSETLERRTDEDCQLIYDFTLGIVERKYQLYEWTETKIGTLVSINSLLIGGVLVLATQEQFGVGKGIVDRLLFVAPLIVLAFSIIFSLVHTASKMDAGIGNIRFRNVRQVAGTQKFTPTEYLERLSELTLRDMIVQNSNQIKGMNSIIWTNQRELRRAVLSTILGVVLTVIWILWKLR